MRQSSLAVAMLAVVHLLAFGPASPAAAATFDAQVDASQSAVEGSHDTSNSDQETLSSSPATADLTFSGSSSAFSLPQRTGSTQATASARSQFDANFLELGVFATTKTSGTNGDGGQFDYRSTCNASASFLDSITVTGGTTGAIGYIHATFALDGVLTSSAAPGLNESVASLLVMAADSIGGFLTLSLSSSDGQAAVVPPKVDFYMKYRFDEEAPFSVSMFAHAFGYLASTASNMTAKADFKNTLRFVTAEILDFDFAPLCADIVSSSGLVYPFGPLDHIVLTPQDATTGAGVPQVYSVRGVDANCHDLGDISSIATLSISPNGTCTGTSCTATVLGVHTVTVHAGGKTAQTTLTIVPGPLHHLVLSPSSATITAGGSQAYTAEGFDAYGNSRGDATAETTFTVSPNGSCAGASCGATAAGPHTVTGTDSGKTGTASLTVNPGPLDHITITPANVTTTAGGSQTYQAHGFDAYENPLGDVTGATTFSISPDGSCNGATCTASIVGPHTVTGDDGGLQATANFNVVAGPPRPDLAITAVNNGPATINRFGRISASDTITNQGTAQSRFSVTRYYISLDQFKNGGDRILLGLRFVGRLNPGQSSSGGENLFVFGAAPGTYYLLACADDLALIAESDESNNCLASPTQIVIQ